MKPLFSVIIPTLNEEMYLPKLLECLVHQTQKDFEVIVVDGQSDDATVRVAFSYRPKLRALRVLPIERRNISFARNCGARAARGEYLVFLDSDVLLPPDYIEHVRKATAQRGARLLTTWYKPDSTNPLTRAMVFAFNVNMEITRVLGRPFAQGFNIVIHSSIFHDIGGFNERLKIAEDHDLILRCSKKGTQLVILRTPTITFSVRRFRLLGYARLLGLYTYTSFLSFLNIPIKQETISYPMGGHLYTGSGRKPLFKHFSLPKARA